jgi:hypothetical protein
MKHEKGEITGESVEQTGGNQPRVILARVQAGAPARERIEEPIGRLGPGLCGGGRRVSTRTLAACWVAGSTQTLTLV